MILFDGSSRLNRLCSCTKETQFLSLLGGKLIPPLVHLTEVSSLVSLLYFFNGHLLNLSSLNDNTNGFRTKTTVAHRVLGNDLVSLIFSTAGTFHSEILELHRTNSGTMENNALKLSGSVLCIKLMLAINTIVEEVRNFDHFKSANRLELARVRVKEGMIVSGIGHESLHHSRVAFRSQKAIAITLRDVVLRHLGTGGKKSLKNLIAILSFLRNIKTRSKLKGLTSTRNKVVILTIIGDIAILGLSVLSGLIGKLIDNSTVSTHSESFTELTGILDSNVVMVHRIVDIRDKAVSRKETIDSDDAFIVFHLLTLVIKGVARCKILSTGTAHNSERSTLTMRNRSNLMTRHHNGGASKSSQNFTREDLHKECFTIARRESLTRIGNTLCIKCSHF
nr:MAG TPA: hypothetical protein [Caudoviricetes sp.]